jgi:O-antigen/teichoic acid export membrane protein
MLDKPRPSLARQLFTNQVWETIAFIAKAAFMLGLTPWMLQIWGDQGYGEFALASSTVVFLSIIDFGIRGRTRVALCAAAARRQTVDLVLGRGAFAFLVSCACTILVVVTMTVSRFGSRILHVQREHEGLLLLTTVLTALVMLSTLLLEPLVARGHLGTVKSATALGWLTAIPTVALLLWLHRSVTWVIFAWLSCLLAANLILLATRCREGFRFVDAWGKVSRCDLLATFHESLWFNISSLTWAAKSHGLTLLLSAISGPVTAGTFFILLRLSEVISALGAISFDVSMGALPQCHSASERCRCFFTTCNYALLFSLPCALGIVAFAPSFFHLWLRMAAPFGSTTGVWIAALGLTVAANRLITYAGLALGSGRVVASCGAVEMLISVAGVALVYPVFGLAPSLIIIVASIIAQVPALRVVCQHLAESPSDVAVPAASQIPELETNGLLASRQHRQPLHS